MKLSIVCRSFAVGAVLLANLVGARADVVADWNATALDAIMADRQGAPFTARSMAIVHTAVFEVLNAVQPRYTSYVPGLQAPAGASSDAAAAAAARTVMLQLCPTQAAAIEKAYAASLAAVPEGEARSKGVAFGEEVGRKVLDARANDGTGAADVYRPRTSPGVYVSTGGPVFHSWASAKPWVMSSPAQFRPGPPPELKGDVWARDLEEIQRVGVRASKFRTPEQTDVARFWVLTGAPAWNGLLRQIAANRKLDALDSARMYALVNIAATDALVAVFDAKYAYEFWRPITAVRNTEGPLREAGWTPLVDTPAHPEYPCAHCISSTAVGTVLQSLFGEDMNPPLTLTSSTAPGVTRSYKSVRDYTTEVSNARVWGGIHYRNSTVVGEQMGQKIGQLVLASVMKPLR